MARLIDKDEAILALEMMEKYDDGYILADHQEILERLREIDPDQAAWIHVKDEPPALGRRVMTCGKFGGIGIGRRHYEDLDNVITMESSGAERGFVYWRPLPALPAGLNGAGKE